MIKHCKKCHTENHCDFSPAQTRSCRNCHKKLCKDYEKTPAGFMMRMYRNMKSRITGVQKAKHHLYQGKDLLSKEDFYAWLKTSNEFNVLFEAYEKSGYDRKLAPSIDRVDSTKGYIIGNIKVITMSENSSRGAKSKKILNQLNKAA